MSDNQKCPMTCCNMLQGEGKYVSLNTIHIYNGTFLKKSQKQKEHKKGWCHYVKG